MATEEIIGIKVTSDTAQATQEVQKLDKAFEETDQTVKGLRQQLKEAVANVVLMSDKFGATSKEAINAAKRAADLKDRIGDAKALTDAFNPDAKFKAVASSLAGVAGGFSALQGAMALFGKQNKDVEAALLKVNAAMALSQGLQSVGESIDSFRQLGAVIKSTTAFQTLNNAATQTAVTIQKAFGISVDTTSKSFNVLKGAIVATGIGALVVALGLVINNFDAISKWIKNSPLGSLAKGVGNLVEQFTDFIGVTSEAERNLNKISAANKRANEDIENRIKVLKAQGGSEKEIYELGKQRIENELTNLRQTLKTKGELTEEEAKQFRNLKTEQLVLTADYNKKSSEATAKAAEKAKKDRDDVNKQVEEDTKAANKMLIDLQNAKSVAIIDDETAKATKQLEIDKKAKEDEIEQLKVSQSVKDELIKLNNEKFDADKAALDKKAKEDLEKKQKEEQDNLDAFNEKIKDIRIAAIKDDNERAEAERLAKLERDLKELDEDKEFIKLSQKEQAKIKKDLIDASEAAGQKSKNEIVKKGLQEELDLLQIQQKSLTTDSKAYWDNAKAIEEASYKLKLDAAKGNAKEIEKINTEHKNNNIAIEKAEAAAKRALLLERLKLVEDFGKNIQVLAGKNKKVAIAGLLIEKAAALGQVVVNTAAATTKAVAASPLTLGLPWSALIIANGALQAAAVVKSAIDGVKAINSAGSSAGLSEEGTIGDSGAGTSVPSTGSGGGSLPSTGGGGAPSTGGGGGGGGSTGGGGGGAVRAYVVQSDIEDAQQRESEIQNRARFE
jgi:hypothetical protein